jgi:hypothetical protein
MTLQDAQLLYDWFVQRYGLPLEGMAAPSLVNGDRDHQHEPNRKRNPHGRIRREPPQGPG